MMLGEEDYLDALYKVRHRLSGGLTGLCGAVDAMGIDEKSVGQGEALLWQSFLRLMETLKEVDGEIVRRRQNFVRKHGVFLPTGS